MVDLNASKNCCILCTLSNLFALIMGWYACEHLLDMTLKGYYRFFLIEMTAL